ncbi:MAG: metal ABC transporter permease [Pseudomonadales bacterium]|nr:metal ABC transporter permease [Pseudomonadales bacterium]
MLEMIDLSIIGPAFVAGLLVLSTHVPLGRKVLQRGIIFLDLAIAQCAALGVVLAGFFFDVENHLAIQMSAGMAAILSAALLNWTERYWLQFQEAIIGSLFVLAATGSILALSGNPHGGEHLKALLVGQILWTTWDQLLPVASVYAGVLGCLWWFKHPLLRFYFPFAISVTLSVQLVGVYLVFASLIIPAIASHQLTGCRGITKAMIIGAFGYGLGLILSSIFDFPSGAIIVWCLAVVAILSNSVSIVRRVFLGRKVGGE